MAQFTLQQGKRYRAKIRLGMFEAISSNDAISERLTEAGLVDVQVWGSGRDRFADGTWTKATTSVELPGQVASVNEAPWP